jgi:hypothetical protein
LRDFAWSGHIDAFRSIVGEGRRAPSFLGRTGDPQLGKAKEG